MNTIARKKHLRDFSFKETPTIPQEYNSETEVISGLQSVTLTRGSMFCSLLLAVFHVLCLIVFVMLFSSCCLLNLLLNLQLDPSLSFLIRNQMITLF